MSVVLIFNIVLGMTHYLLKLFVLPRREIEWMKDTKKKGFLGI